MDNLVHCVEHGDDAQARLNMANAALLAGVSFTNAMVGVVHSLAHACGGVAHVPHGIANAIFLPWGVEYNIDKVAEFIADLAPFMGVSPAASPAQTAAGVVQAIRELTAKLNQLCGMPLTLREAGVDEGLLETIAEKAINDGSVVMNPEEVTVEDALALLKKAY